MEKMIDVKQLCDVLGVTRRHIMRMRADGELPPAYRVGRRALRWRAEDIERWLDGRREGSV